MPGRVYLVGAGPGDPELLTRKAWRVLQTAEVVLHDDLVPPEILRTLPSPVQLMNVGKRCGAKNVSQDAINALMIQLAREGKAVVRLKSGDPTLFGRAGEEIEALRQAGIEFEIVPGVTAALGAAAVVGISLTDRRLASRVVFVTGHREGGTGLHNEGQIAADTTYVIYMPGSRYAALAAELQAAGLGVGVPCAVISRATTKNQTLVRTTIGQLPSCPAAVSPSLVIVGQVLSEKAISVAHELPGELEKEILEVALQHPFHEQDGRNGVE